MRGQYSTHKYSDPFAGYLDERVVGQSGQDDETGDIESSYGSVVLIGRHILTYSTQGFVDRDTYPTAHDARAVFERDAAIYASVSHDEEELTAGRVITAAWVRAQVQRIDRYQDEEEDAHYEEDQLHVNVLAEIAAGAPNAAELAREALRTGELDFRRYYS